MSETATQAPIFRQAKNGYERVDVDAHIDELNQRLTQAADRADAERRRAEEAARAAETARKDRDELERRADMPGYDVLADRIRTILETADEAAAELRTRSEVDARICKREAEEQASGIVASARVEAAGIVEDGRAEAAKLTADAAAVKKQAEASAAEILGEARVEAEQTVRRGRQEGAAAIAEADRRVETLRGELAQLEAQRDQALAALGTLRDRLTRAAQDLIPAGDERPTSDGSAA